MSAHRLGGYLVSVPIPWDERGVFDEARFRGAVAKLIGEGCDGIYLFGTSGEGYAVSDADFAAIVATFADATRGFDGFRQAGCFGLVSSAVKERCRIALDHGLEGVQVTLPFWKPLNDDEVRRYFEDVCGGFPDLTFLLYNNPRNKRRLTGAEIESAHAVAPNLAAAKTAPPGWREAYELITESPSIRHFVTEMAFPFSYPLGAAGLIPSSNYTFPERARAFYEAVVAGDHVTAAKLHRDITGFFHRTATPLGAKGYIDGAIDKAYARLGGMDMPLAMRAPYLPLSDEDFAWLESVVREKGV